MDEMPSFQVIPPGTMRARLYEGSVGERNRRETMNVPARKDGHSLTANVTCETIRQMRGEDEDEDETRKE
jgi:hypothetical protein